MSVRHNLVIGIIFAEKELSILKGTTMSGVEKVDYMIVSGFLGAGKTTTMIGLKAERDIVLSSPTISVRRIWLMPIILEPPMLLSTRLRETAFVM